MHLRERRSASLVKTKHIHKGQLRKLRLLGFALDQKMMADSHSDCVYWKRMVGKSEIRIALMAGENISFDELANRIARQGAYRAIRKFKDAVSFITTEGL